MPNSVIEPTSGKKLHQNSVRLRLPPPACQVFWQSRLIYSTEYCTATVYCIRRQAAGVLACTRGRLYAESEVGIMPETVHARCRLPHKAYFGAGTRDPAGAGRGGLGGALPIRRGLSRDPPGGGERGRWHGTWTPAWKCLLAPARRCPCATAACRITNIEYRISKVETRKDRLSFEIPRFDIRKRR